MWVLLTFDLPVESKAQKRAYVRFVKCLKKRGFFRLQYSVFARPCASDEQAESHAKSIAGDVPDEGEVRLLNLTDLQFGRQSIIVGGKRGKPEEPPSQLTLF